MKQKLERYIHLNMALIGGFIGGYAILNHHDLFGSAQTANMIALAQDFAGKENSDWLIRCAGLLLYMAGIASTVIIPKKVNHVNLKTLSIFTDIAALITVGLLPADTSHFIALYPLFFATAMQWCAFPGSDGYVGSTIFSTNNLRQFTASFTEYFMSHDAEALRRGRFYGRVLVSYHLGVMAAFVASHVLGLGLHSSFLCLLPACTALLLLYAESHGKTAPDAGPDAGVRRPVHPCV